MRKLRVLLLLLLAVLCTHSGFSQRPTDGVLIDGVYTIFVRFVTDDKGTLNANFGKNDIMPHLHAWGWEQHTAADKTYENHPAVQKEPGGYYKFTIGTKDKTPSPNSTGNVIFSSTTNFGSPRIDLKDGTQYEFTSGHVYTINTSLNENGKWFDNDDANYFSKEKNMLK